MKKKILLILGILFCQLSSHSQTYTQLLTDPQGDNTNFVPDLGTISYAMNMAHDSIWFKVQTYNSIPDTADFGLEIGIDTDMNISNGFVWDGSNHSMKCDEVLFVMQDGTDGPGVYYCALGRAGNNPPLFNAHVTRPDNYTFIISAKLSLLDNDGRFNVVFGGALFDCQSGPGAVFDDAPDAGYKTITPTTEVLSINEENEINIYPNPLSGNLFIDAKMPMEVKIINCIGSVVSSMHIKKGRNEVNMEDVKAGLYFIVTDDWRYRIIKL